jgi:Zn-dependent M28 family amino/carboxypeptidase
VTSGPGIEVQLDPELGRQTLRRSDHWPFIQAGIPSTGFIFGYRPGSESDSAIATGTRCNTTTRRMI